MKKLAIVGATGLVGTTTLNVLHEEGLFEKFEIYLFVSDKSAGKILVFNDCHYPLIKLDDDFEKFNLDYAIFLTGEDVSKVWVKKFASAGVRTIDNSCAFRLKKKVPLIVPEINSEILLPNDNIIANPNCSTIQLVVVLDKLNKLSKIKQVVVSSYQSVSGAGREALLDLENETNSYFKHGISNNFIAQIGELEKNGNSKEENKIINETKKILNENLEIFATAVRVPISYCHGESVFIRFDKKVNMKKLKSSLNCEHIKRSEDLFFPCECAGKNETFVCRIRQADEKSVQLFIIADNLRRGAAYNAVKILEIISQS